MHLKPETAVNKRMYLLNELDVSVTKNAAATPPAACLSEEQGSICLVKASFAVRKLCPRAGEELRGELASALLPGLLRRARKWRPGPKTFEQYAQHSAFQSLKDHFRHLQSNKCALNRHDTVSLSDLGDSTLEQALQEKQGPDPDEDRD